MVGSGSDLDGVGPGSPLYMFGFGSDLDWVGSGSDLDWSDLDPARVESYLWLDPDPT